MSEVDHIDNVMTLEDLFLSAEFGRTVVDTPAPVVDPLFLETSPGAPLRPLVAFPSTTGTHGTTTHMRRNRAFATASGVAAALLIAVGFISSTGKPGKSSGEVQAISGSAGGGGTGIPIAGDTPPTGSGSSTELSDLSGGAGGKGAAVTLANHVGGTVTPTGPGTSVTPITPPTPSSPSGSAPSGSVLSPVVSLLGHVVVTTGTTVTGLGGDLTTALPPLTPVTNIVSGLGGTLSGLGNSLVVAAA